jgi:hypothetical protein
MPVYSDYADRLANDLAEPFKSQVLAVLAGMAKFDATEDTDGNDTALLELRAALATLLGPYSKEASDRLLAIGTLQTIVEQEDEIPWEDFLANLWEPATSEG